jgi:hypothetical protein
MFLKVYIYIQVCGKSLIRITNEEQDANIKKFTSWL